MSRWRRRTAIDGNQPQLIEDLRRIPGVTVSIIGHPVDLLVGYRGVNHVWEVKDPEQPPSGRKLTPDQVDFFARWTGHVRVIETFEEALIALGLAPSKPREQP